MSLKRKIKKISKKEFKQKSSTIYIFCKNECGRGADVPGDVVAWTCSYCVQKMCPWEEPNQPSGRPRGWHFKKYFEFDGKVYSKGVEITDKKEIKKLKKAYGNVTANSN